MHPDLLRRFGANSIGMDNVTIQAGIGNDVITAQGALGVQDVLINGGEGSDIFNLGSGTGTIVGGIPISSEIDLLILDGQSLDYTFSGITDLNLGTIVNDDLGTNLTVFNVDEFRFSDGTFAFDELFGETPPPPELPELSIQATDANKEEGNDGANPFTFTVTRTEGTSQETTVTWTAAPAFSNPVEANDFVAGTIFTDELTFQPGENSLDITLNVNGDLTFEENEGFTVTLSNPINGTITQATATGTILNDDQEPEQGETISRRQINGETIEGTDLSDSYEATQGGIRQSTFETLGGNDSIISFSENGSAIVFTQISTSDGDDTVSAETTVGNSPAINFSEINTGANADTVIAKNTSDSSGATAIDDQVIINTGDGNDTIIAEAESFPIKNSTIKTGSGNDTIELRGGNDGLDNGLGTIDGGSGDQDLLILGGTSIRYLYELEDSTELQGNISAGDFGNTDLDLTGVEFFQFTEEPGTTYAFDELFTGEFFGVGGFVWDDLNRNGLQDSGEPGIEGVPVALQNTFTGETLETTTDVDGL